MDGLEAMVFPIDLTRPLAEIIYKRNFAKISRRLPNGSGVFGVNGQTFSKYINEKRIDYACDRLDETGHIVMSATNQDLTI